MAFHRALRKFEFSPAIPALRGVDLKHLAFVIDGAPQIVCLAIDLDEHLAIIPLYDALRDVLEGIPKKSPRILTNSRGRPWTRDGFNSTFYKAKINAGLGGANLHFHDLRGTAATNFHIAGLSIRVIAEIMAWEEEHVEKIIRRYVGRSAATKAAIEQLNKAERRT